MKEKFALAIGWVVGLAIFGGWMSIVGNPHVVETIMGVVFGLIGGVWIYFKINPDN